MGRTLEPWRAILAVAHWLEDQGATDLYPRMLDLAQAYQTERGDLEPRPHRLDDSGPRRVLHQVSTPT